MIKVQTILKIVDNTGGVYAMCIKILNISKRLGVLPGHETKCTIKKKRSKKKVYKKFKEIKKGFLYTCLLIRNVRSLKRWGGFSIQTLTNAVILINQYNIPLGSRIFGPIYSELKNYIKYSKVLSLAEILL